jgi:hypothetical protein
MSVSRSYLLILSDRDAIAWVLREQRMAFPATRRAELALTIDDRLLLYTTRGAWSNPTHSRGRVIGTATVRSPVRGLDKPLEVAGRHFYAACDLQIDGLVPYPGGVELQPLVSRLAVFPKPEAWSAYLRRTLLQLPQSDVDLLTEHLAPMSQRRPEALATYPRIAAAVTSADLA